MNKAILITGVERSGSTVVAEILKMCGAFTGQCTNNMENVRITPLLNALYMMHDVDQRGQYPMPTSDINFPSKGLYNDVMTALKMDGYVENRIWMYKNSRIGQTWQMWNEAFPKANWIVVRRKPHDIVQSCMKTSYMTAFKEPYIRKQINVNTPEEGWQWWIKEHMKRFSAMKKHIEFTEIWPERFAKGDFSQIKAFVEKTGLKWNNDIPFIVEPLLKQKR